MLDQEEVYRTAEGAACAVFDGDGRVRLVRHTHGRLNWELPGGGARPGETPDEAASREVLEETGLRAEIDRLTGVYLEPGDGSGPMLHFVFRCRWRDGLEPVASSAEVSDARFWRLDELPAPMSDSTERRIRDAVMDGPARIRRVSRRRWRT